MDQMSDLGQLRQKYEPSIPEILQNIAGLYIETDQRKEEKTDERLIKIFPHIANQPMVFFKKKEKKEYSPLKIGVVFSGGQASGGHNVIAGIFDAIKSLNEKSLLLGFLNGPSGIINEQYIEITQEFLFNYRNQGGFDLIGSGRTKIETVEQLKSSLQTVERLKLDGLVIIGGDDSNTNAAILAEYFLKNNCKTCVIGVPKTIDGDLKNQHIPISFGFDTACKVYSELIGNISRDALSAKKYYHFIKLMGRSASHITLECALKTQPNFILIAEEVEEKKKTLNQIIEELTTFIEKRAKESKDYGVVLVPEGLIEFIPEMKQLIRELNDLLGKNPEVIQKMEAIKTKEEQLKYIGSVLSQESLKTFSCLPEKIKLQLLLDRDPHGNVQVSLIETEQLLIEKVKMKLDKKIKFKAQAHFLGYEGRAAYPSNFDANYCYCLGLVATTLLKDQKTGYICALSDLHLDAKYWKPKGVPLVSLMHIELRKGEEKPVIKKALVDLDGKSFKTLNSQKNLWQAKDMYSYPGPIQYFGEAKITDTCPLTLKIEKD